MEAGTKRSGFAILIFLMLSAAMGLAQQNYWVPKDPPKAAYRMTVTIDPTGDSLQGEESIMFRNHTDRSLYQIAFNWPQISRHDIQVLENGTPLWLVNDQGNRSLEPLLYELARPLSPNQTLEINISFSKKVITAGNSDKVKLRDGWYPHLSWDGIRTPDDYFVKIIHPKEYTIAASGRLDTSTGFFQSKGTRYFAVFLGKNHHILSKEIGGVLVSVVYPDSSEQVASLVFNTAIDAIPFFTKLFGFFPFKHFSIIPGNSSPQGGFNLGPGIAVIHGMNCFSQMPPIFWQYIMVHEICHHYWGEYVYDGDDPSWLWIALGIYTDREYFKSKNLTVGYYAGFRQRYLQMASKHQNTTLDATTEEVQKFEMHSSDFDWNMSVNHGKGFTVISALESVLGAQTFHEILVRCLKEFAGKPLGYKKFQEVCEEVSGQNLNWFFNQWVRSNKHLDLSIRDSSCVSSGSQYLSTIHLVNTGDLRMPVTVRVTFSDSTSQTAIINRLIKTPTLKFESNALLRSIEIDPEKTCRRWVRKSCPPKTNWQCPWIISRTRVSVMKRLSCMISPPGSERTTKKHGSPSA